MWFRAIQEYTRLLKNEFQMILEELKRIEAGTEVNEDLLEVIMFLAEIMNGMKEETEWTKE